jgi:hypothetical protein
MSFHDDVQIKWDHQQNNKQNIIIKLERTAVREEILKNIIWLVDIRER